MQPPTPTSGNGIRLGAAFLAVAQVLMLSACSAAPFSCGKVTSPGVTGTATASTPPMIALLVEMAPRGSAVLKEARARALDEALSRGFSEGATLLVGVIGGAGQATLAVGPTRLIESGNNPLQCSEIEHAVRAKVAKTLDRTSDQPPDVLGGLQLIASSLDRSVTHAGLDVVIVSSMLNNTDILPGTALRADPNQVLPDLRSKGLLPDCAGWRIYVVGPGVTAAGGPVMTLLANLHRFWDAAFRSCGGQLWGFQPELTAFPASGPLPAPPQPPGPCVSETIPAGVFFDTDSAVIRPDAQAEVAQITSFVRVNLQGHTFRALQVVGNTDSDGDANYNQTLSERRAESVAGAIASQIPGLTVDAFGLGATDPVAPNDSAENKAKNRRVVVSVLCDSSSLPASASGR